MKINKRVAALTAGAALLAIPAVAGPANADTYAGTIRLGWTTGIPTAVHRGQTITITLWGKQTSPYVLHSTSDEINLNNPKGFTIAGNSAPGVTLAWQDPFTKRWMPNSSTFRKGSINYFRPSKYVTLTSGVWIHINVRITFSKTAPLGTWTLDGSAPSGWTVYTKTGRQIDAQFRLAQVYRQPIRVVR